MWCQMPKLNKDQISEDVKLKLGELERDNTITLDECKQYCREVILMGVSSERDKLKFVKEINKAQTKVLACWPVYNYLLAGEGKSVNG